MDNEDKKLAELRYKINALRKRNVKKVEWRLTDTEAKYVEELLGKEKIVPYIYNIETRSFKNLHEIKSSIIREVHYKHKAGKKTIGKYLKKREYEELIAYGIKPKPVKYWIYLN